MITPIHGGALEQQKCNYGVPLMSSVAFDTDA